MKSTSLIGGASLINILIGMVRTKFVAMLIGPTGVGLLGMYGQITGLVGNVSGMGLGTSGVRQVAEAAGSGDDEKIARVVLTLRRTVWLTGSLGMMVMILFCIPISVVTFKSNQYALSIALLGITILLGAITTSQSCILRGTRKIAELAKISIIGAVSSTLISIPCYYLWGQVGIVPSLILGSIAALVSSWLYARRISIKSIKLPWRESCGVARNMMWLGLAIMGAGFVNLFSEFVIRVFLNSQFDLRAVGIYQAANGLSGILVSFVLNAMGTDYYSRLTAEANDKVRVKQMVNEQSDISILLALPGLAAIMIFAPLVIKLFYTVEFVSAVPILRWCTFGVLGRVLSWPLVYVILAQGKGRLYFITESTLPVFHILLVYTFCKFWGLEGAGIAYMVMYLFYTMLMLTVIHRLIGTTWTHHTLKLSLIATAAMVALMLNSGINTNLIAAWSINLIVLCGVTWFCLNQLSRQSDIGFQALLVKLQFKK